MFPGSVESAPAHPTWLGRFKGREVLVDGGCPDVHLRLAAGKVADRVSCEMAAVPGGCGVGEE